MIETIKLCAKVGLEYFLVASLVWLLAYVIKHTVVKQSEMIERLLIALNKLSERIEKHEQEANSRGVFVMQEHKEMIKALDRMNGS